MTLEFSQHF